MTTEEMQKAINEARRTFRAADDCSAQIAEILAGRLKTGNVRHHVLCQLKKELDRYNMHTRTWRG